MKLAKSMAVLAAAGALSGACSTAEAPAGVRVMEQVDSDQTFLINPDHNLSAANCQDNPSAWVAYTDANPLVADEVGTPFTIGFAESYDAVGRPIFAIGATILDKGDFQYEISTINDVPGKATWIHLSRLLQGYSRVLSGGAGSQYDAVLSARVDTDGTAKFSLNCLPNESYEYAETTPLDELPAIPGETPPTSLEPTEPGPSAPVLTIPPQVDTSYQR